MPVFDSNKKLPVLRNARQDKENGCQPKTHKPPNSKNVPSFNMIPPKVEFKLGGSILNGPNNSQAQTRNTSRPIDISGSKISSSSCISKSLPNTFQVPRANVRCRKKLNTEDSKLQQTFGNRVDDPIMSEDFDFEGNLALFDKKAVWDDIEAKRKPADKIPKGKLAVKPKQKTYRHDENILGNDMVGLRQIETDFSSGEEFVTDQGLIIPTIPHYVRAKVQKLSVDNYLTMDRQNDMLARGTTELALIMLGGARRLIPNNIHQWPIVVIIGDKNQCGDIAAATGRHLASHGLKVVLYFQSEEIHTSNTKEVALFKATGNIVVNTVDGKVCICFFF